MGRGSNGSTNVDRSRRSGVSTCDLLTVTRKPVVHLTRFQEEVISITFGTKPIKHVTCYCGKFGDIQLCVGCCRLLTAIITITRESLVMGHTGHVGHGSVY